MVFRLYEDINVLAMQLWMTSSCYNVYMDIWFSLNAPCQYDDWQLILMHIFLDNSCMIFFFFGCAPCDTFTIKVLYWFFFSLVIWDLTYLFLIVRLFLCMFWLRQFCLFSWFWWTLISECKSCNKLHSLLCSFKPVTA